VSEMDATAIVLRSNRPRCMGTDAQGRRCREPVVWDHTTARPMSTRCEAHGGLADAALMSWQSLDPADLPGELGSGAGAADVRADSQKTLRGKGLGRSLGSLPALILAAALCLAAAGPALSDFESAVADYEDGAYREAQTEFEALAAAGEGRATLYLERIREKLRGGRQSDESITSTVMDSVTSIFGGSDRPSDGSASSTLVTDAGPSTAARSPEGASGSKSAGWEPWSPFSQGAEPAPLPVSDVAIPQNRSIWSAIFHLPGDATVIGLQYAAQFLGADNLSRELQYIGRHSDKIALSILAGLWWLAIIRGVVGIAVGLGRFMRAATTITEQKRYG